MTAQLQQLQTQVQPLEDQISRVNGQLLLLESYKQEYSMYSSKYEMVDTLKKYSSPTGGIQTLFMSIYMNKTLELANQVLSMVFGDQYRILDYVINANEFRIPFVGGGMVVDDISSGSTSQVCMMGLAMNLVLLYQASTRYNITRLDEIDGGLDTRNRLEFVNALYKVIDILNIDQLFIISHSLELELSNVDMIRLKMYDNYESPEGNVLYDFQSSTLE
jgi:DNA repair exonuclease SbcCD ATPase subunit